MLAWTICSTSYILPGHTSLWWGWNTWGLEMTSNADFMIQNQILFFISSREHRNPRPSWSKILLKREKTKPPMTRVMMKTGHIQGEPKKRLSVLSGHSWVLMIQLVMVCCTTWCWTGESRNKAPVLPVYILSLVQNAEIFNILFELKDRCAQCVSSVSMSLLLLLL